MRSHNYFIYIITNPGKTALYVGVTNDLKTRLEQHKANRDKLETFTGRYFYYNLIYYERYTHIEHAIVHEKELKLMSRKEKIDLIKKENPYLRFLKIEDQIMV